MRTLPGALAVALVVFATPTMGDSLETESISGSSLRAIQAAMPEASKVMVGLDEYIVRVAHRDETIVVVFADREDDRVLGAGGGGRIPEFEIELAKDDLQFLRLHYVR